MKRRLTDDDKEYILKNRNMFFISEIAETLNCNYAVIQQFLKRKNLTYKSKINNGNELTTREKEVLKLYSMGLTRKEISEKLCVSFTTIATHLSNIFNKLGVDDRQKASIIYWQNNIDELKNVKIEELI